jgi:cysteinyl-tRNA synthetase, unknown class
MAVMVLRYLLRAFALALLAGGVYLLHVTPAPLEALTPREGPALTEATSWGYQLQAPVRRLVPPEIDVMVIDYSFDGTDSKAFSSADLELFRRRPNGKPRIVLAYMSIGEAETYRFYWWKYWRYLAPRWLAREDKNWKGNYWVRYWHQGWQQLLFNDQRSVLDSLAELYLFWRKPYLDRIIEAGFDGVYLDRVDAYSEWSKGRVTAEDDMAALVSRLSSVAKARKPGFLIVPQNGEELLEKPAYRAVIDGIAKEDLLFGEAGDGKPNAADDVANTIALLSRLKAEGKPVFVVEYLKDAAQRDAARAQLTPLGFVLHFAERALQQTPEYLPSPPPVNATPTR